jgi:hypothetical protein
MSCRIQNFCKVDHTTVKASFDIDFGPVKVRNFNLIETVSHGRFISEPSEKYQKDGQQKFKDIAILTDDLVRAQIYADIKTLYTTAPDLQPQ